MNLYSLTTIENTVYLNKVVLQQQFQEFFAPDKAHHGQQRNITRRMLWLLAAPFTWNNKDHQYTSDDSRMSDDFLFHIRKKIVRDTENPTQRRDADQEEYFILQGSPLIHAVIRAIIEATRGSNPSETRQIQTDLIQKIVGVINTLIKDINLELSPFGLSLNKQLTSTFHTCAIVLLTKYYYNEQQNHFLQTLSTLSDRKKDLQTYFISMVVPNTSVDITSGISLCKQVKEFTLKNLLDDGQKLINFELRQYDCLNRKWIQDRCDGKLLTADPQWYLDYIENPTKIIEEFFNETWKNIQVSIDQNLMQLKANYDDALQNFFHCIRGIQDTLKHAGRAAKFVDDIFQPEEHNQLNANQNFNNKRRCMAILLLNYFSGQQLPEIYTCHNNRYHLTDEARNTFDLLTQRYKPSEKLSTITKAMTSVYDSCSVDNLSAFLQCILEEKLMTMGEFHKYPCDFNNIDTQDTYARLRDKIRGCPDRCPCCRRPCDADHTQIKSKPGSEDNKHRCETGHALRAMNGYKFEKSDEASLFMCEQITDDQTILVGQQRYNWSQFQLLHPDWIFESLLNDEELTRLHEKFLTIWSKIGVDLCSKYGMKFVTFNSQKSNMGGSIHFILLLDGSGSMRGQPWTHLVAAVREFIQRRKDLRTRDHITIISFSDHAKIEYFDEEINNISVNSLTYHGGGTSFSAAFAQANECINRSQGTGANYAIIFMSDGESTYPAHELNTLLRLHQQVIKKFWTLALGHASMSVLNQINQQMNGAFFDVEESSRLVEAYAEIARTS